VASHAVLSEPGREPPVLLLDDVFSELDHYRATALVAQLPRNQTILTTAGDLPAGMEIGKVVELTADHSLAAPGIL
jgi:DNA replication and repair protein RecF